MSTLANIPNRVCFDDILMTDNEKECPVCYETVPSGVNNCTTDCGHAFCFTCIMKCLEKNNTCPICRHILQEEQQYDDNYDDDENDDDENDDAENDDAENDDDENDDDENDSNVSGTEPEINYEDYHPANIEYITEVMKEKGFIMRENLLVLLKPLFKLPHRKPINSCIMNPFSFITSVMYSMFAG